MKRRRVWYTITNFSGYWMQRGEWVKDIDDKYGAQNYASAKTFKKAIRIANRCPAEMIITKFYIKHGKRWCRDYILGEDMYGKNF